MNINRQRLFDFSMGVQNATSWLLKRPNELVDARNVQFHPEIGSMVGRPGITAWGDAFASPAATPQGAHTAQFKEGEARFVAVNRTVGGNTNTYVMSQNLTTGAWTDLITDLPANAEVFFTNFRNEVFVSGYDPVTKIPFQPRNINSALNVSTTRNLRNCPYPHYFVEYLGIMYAVNVYFNSTRYPDRAYKSSAPTGAITYIQSAQSGTLTSLKVDSVRYLKVGMAIDIYTKGTTTKVHDLTITSVDKVANTISFASTSINVGDNDEVWIDGGIGTLEIFWNTDYPTTDRSDFTAIYPGTDSTNEITGAIKSSNRLFLFTENSGNRFDGQNTVSFNNTVGCISQRTLKNLDDDWMIWLDATGRVRARNEAQGQQEFISRGIHNSIMSNFTEDDLRGMHAVVHDQKYKLFVGPLDGEQVRVSYDFEGNTWSPESLGVIPGQTIVGTHDGIRRPIIFGTDGLTYIDELGNDDDGKPIQFMSELGRMNFGTEGKKLLYGLFIYSEHAIGLKVMAARGNKQFKTMGQITDDECFIKVPESGASSMVENSSFNIKITGRYSGLPPVIEGIVPYFVNREDIPGNG